MKYKELTIFRVAMVDIRVRVTGGGHTSQIYAIRQAIAKSIVRSTYPPLAFIYDSVELAEK